MSENELRVEYAFDKSLNFQNIKRICENFDRLDKNLAIRQEVMKKYGRRNESLYDFIERVANHRHRYVHHSEKDLDYDMRSLKRDIKYCELLICSIYKAIAKHNKWTYEKP